MLAVGQQCEHPTCMMVDFLPFTCSHCQHKYCLEHFQPDAHTCPSHDPNAGDRVAPNCPLCNVPVSVPLGQDPNARMERHFASECMVMLGEMGRKRAAASRMPVCASRACNKKLIAPIQCTGCNMKFCAQHRYASDHDCPSEAAKAAALQKQAKAKAASASASASKPSSSTTSTPNRPAPQAAAALAALKRSVASATTKPAPAPTRTTTAAAPKPAPKTSSGSGAPPSSTSTPAAPQPAPKHKPHNPFSNTDRCDPSPPPPASAASSSAQSSASSPPTPPQMQMQTGRDLDDLDDLLLGSWAPPRVFVSA
ncbi:hypothetical protein EXIGLDRAFT_717920 [Exidia glandulosa HHB12029]|uniref:AN1-type domain-containing protein n=1 Tax=Exidia glandulosa HHB12029 TaxID=1314781 RepID=A0A165P1C9_EXIGL|nr:hypothetical protein EXIGLDRAFT_717920 [Exidia glandulosa HHB12029]